MGLHVVFWLMLWGGLTPRAHAQDDALRRVALVIGNGEYQHVGRLAQAPVDAEVIAQTLSDLGYDVDLQQNADRNAVMRALVAFGDELDDADVGFFYYAGHGVQVDGVNYLVPTDANLESPDYAQSDAIDAQSVLATMARSGAPLNVVVLDACRNNPFVGQWSASGRSVASRGLTVMDAPRDSGFLIGFATSPGAVAADSGAYASSLGKQLRRPCLSLPEAFAHVRDDVSIATERMQQPWLNFGAGVSAYGYYPAGCEQGDRASVAAPTLERQRTSGETLLDDLDQLRDLQEDQRRKDREQAKAQAEAERERQDAIATAAQPMRLEAKAAWNTVQSIISDGGPEGEVALRKFLQVYEDAQVVALGEPVGVDIPEVREARAALASYDSIRAQQRRKKVTKRLTVGASIGAAALVSFGISAAAREQYVNAPPDAGTLDGTYNLNRGALWAGVGLSALAGGVCLTAVF